MYFDETQSIFAQIKLFNNISTSQINQKNRRIKSYETDFESIDNIYTQLCTIFVIKLLINICLTYETDPDKAMQYTQTC